MSKFAENTQVSAERSRAEIEKILMRYEATGFMYGWEKDRALICFAMNGRQIRFLLPMPDRNSEEITMKTKYTQRSKDQQQKMYDQMVRQRWRALALAVKAKLECVESGITTFEEEFLAHIVLPNGSTVGAFMKPQIQDAYTNGKMPLLLGEARA